MTPNRYAQKRAAGICGHCSRPAKKSLCKPCADTAAARKRLKGQKVCECGKLAVKGIGICQRCIEMDWFDIRMRSARLILQAFRYVGAPMPLRAVALEAEMHIDYASRVLNQLLREGRVERLVDGDIGDGELGTDRILWRLAG